MQPFQQQMDQSPGLGFDLRALSQLPGAETIGHQRVCRQKQQMGGRMSIGKRKRALSLSLPQDRGKDTRLLLVDSFALSQQRLPQRGQKLIDALKVGLADTETEQD